MSSAKLSPRQLTWIFAFGILAATVASAEPEVPEDKVTQDDPSTEAATPADPEVPWDLDQEFRNWLNQAQILITPEERAAFLRLDEDFRRRAFIEEFWDQRDPYDDTPYNELKRQWDERAAEVLAQFNRFDDVRAQLWLLNGPPPWKCTHRTREIEIWRYGDEDSAIILLLYTPHVGMPYQVYIDGYLRQILRRRPADVGILDMCRDDMLVAAQRIASGGMFQLAVQNLLKPPDPPANEWVAAFRARSAELPENAETFEAELGFDYPGYHQSRTVVQGVLAVPRDALTRPALADPMVPGLEARHHFLLTGEVVRDDQLFETFRYRFEVPTDPSSSEPLALVFQRYLRPGDARLILKLENLGGRRFAHRDLRLEVPSVGRPAPAGLEVPRLANSELYRYLAEADAATSEGERSLRLLPPPGVVHTGLVRFSTLSVGAVDKVIFYLDEQPILTKRRPPFSVELDLGDMPSIHRLRAAAYHEEAEVASDEIVLNPGGQRFRVRLTEPRSDKAYEHSVRATVQVIVPDGEVLERVEIYLDETLVATLYQEPFVQPVLLGGRRQAYVRAVAYLDDGSSNEDLVFINAPDFVEEVDVQFVELYATVLNRKGRPVAGLERDAFTVLEDGERQELRRFSFVEDLPIHAALLVDVSASMEDSLESVSEAARTFVAQSITPRDRAAVIAFNDQPQIESRFVNDVVALEDSLQGLRASGGTALYDSLVFALHYFHGVKGQKALLLLSDGEDETSGFEVDQALEFARRAGVTIYTIGLEQANLDRRAKKVLDDFAVETGGKSFFIDDLAELPGIYAEIQQELRSQYFLGYQSMSDKDASEFRKVEVKVEVDGEKVEVRTMSGYYP